MTVKPLNICLCNVQTLFVRGGAEAQMSILADQLRLHGHKVDSITMPLLHSPRQQLVSNMVTWRMLDLEAYADHLIDLVIPSKFPAYLVRHPHKIIWLIHQVREVYDLYNTDHYYLKDNCQDNEIREMIINIDNRVLPEAQRIFTISRNVSDRLKRFNGLDSKVLYPPSPLNFGPQQLPLENFILSAGRLEPIKRFDLLIKALQHAPAHMKAVIVGVGPLRQPLEYLAQKLELTDRITFTGTIEPTQLIDLYHRCNAVFFAPFDEDFGLVTLEAFQAAKPVITCYDAGGPLEFVRHLETGLVCEPEARAIADMIALINSQPQQARTMGQNGLEAIKDITWDNVVSTLLHDL
ncbi:glycosyltransferase family 4 protein [bacterium]|nr:glycosyltransferase family 4 protein [bacterium]